MTNIRILQIALLAILSGCNPFSSFSPQFTPTSDGWKYTSVSCEDDFQKNAVDGVLSASGNCENRVEILSALIDEQVDVLSDVNTIFLGRIDIKSGSFVDECALAAALAATGEWKADTGSEEAARILGDVLPKLVQSTDLTVSLAKKSRSIKAIRVETVQLDVDDGGLSCSGGLVTPYPDAALIWITI